MMSQEMYLKYGQLSIYCLLEKLNCRKQNCIIKFEIQIRCLVITTNHTMTLADL